MERQLTDEESLLQRLAGTMPDGEVAACAGVTVDAVEAYRRAHGVAPFLEPPPGSPGPAAATPGGSSTSRRLPPEADAPEADAPAAAVPRRRGRRGSDLAPFADRMGREPDGAIARAAGVSVATVGAWRRSRGIPAYDGYLWRSGDSPEPSAWEAIAPHASLLGQVSDKEVALRAGVGAQTVARWRRDRGIPAAHPRASAAAPDLRPRGAAKASRGRRERELRRAAAAEIAPVAPVAPVASVASVAPVAPEPRWSVHERAYRVVARVDGQPVEYVVMAPEIASAAAFAQARLGPGASVEQVQLLGLALGG